jgi:hypothetical protein
VKYTSGNYKSRKQIANRWYMARTETTGKTNIRRNLIFS